MNRKVISIFAMGLFVFAFFGCSSNPEKGLLSRYFNALAMNDLNTLSTMAIEPVSFEVDSWNITNVSEPVIRPANLADLNTTELDFKKQVEDSVGITLDAQADRDDAVFKRNNARTSAARRAAQKEVDVFEAAFVEQREKHNQLQKSYNQAKEEASREEDVTSFSLGSDYPNVRQFVGEVQIKDVDVDIVGKDGATVKYKIYLRRYLLEDEAAGLDHRGRWIIVNFEKLS